MDFKIVQRNVPFFEQLEARVMASNSLLCIGLDPHTPQLAEPTAEAALNFCFNIIDECHSYAAAFKPNSAFFEALGPAGLDALIQVVARCHRYEVPVVLDVKRGDIDSTAKAYAMASYDIAGADAVTLSPYMGFDSLHPFLTGPYSDKAAFVLCKTSNKTSKELQELTLQSQEHVYDKVASLCRQWNDLAASLCGDSRSRIGVVLGATDVAVLRSVRQQDPQVWVLCPGVGAQGGQAGEVCLAGLRNDGSGLLVSVSRGISESSSLEGGLAGAALAYRDLINTARESQQNQLLQSRTEGATGHLSSLSDDTRAFISFALDNNALKFGTFTLKSGRISPFFFNAGMFCSGSSLSVLSRHYARAIRQRGVQFDAFFGPAYKGIPLASCVATAWFELYNESKGVSYSRKEEKTHGEGGCLVGASLNNKRVLIIDDVITAGTAIRESLSLLSGRSGVGAIVAGVVVALDREERTAIGGELGAVSAIQEIESEHGIPVVSVAKLSDLVQYVSSESRFSAEEVASIVEYRRTYGV